MRSRRRGGWGKRPWAETKMHSPYPDGQLGHLYQAGAAHTHYAPYVLPPSVGYLHSVKISAYHTNVPKERGGDKGEQRGMSGMWVGRCEGEEGEERRGVEGRRGRGGDRGKVGDKVSGGKRVRGEGGNKTEVRRGNQ